MRSRALPLLLAVAFVATACGLLPADLQHELLPSQTQYKTAEAAYSVLIEFTSRQVSDNFRKQILLALEAEGLA